MNSMVSLGYRMRFRNAASGLYGQVRVSLLSVCCHCDPYGYVTQLSFFTLPSLRLPSLRPLQVDSYGNVRTVIEREPVKDVKIAFGSELRLLGQAENAFGLSITVGNQPVLPRVLSPILMSRSVFGSA